MAETSDWWVNGCLIAVIFIFWAYFKVKSIYSYFEERGIPYVKPIFIIGSDVRGALAKDGLAMILDRLYKALDGKKIGGCFLGITPIHIVLDPEYINRILTTYFDNFQDRPFLIDEKTNPTEGHLFFLSGKRWKSLRHKLSPVFTTSKLKYMYDEISKCSDMLISHMDNLANGKDINLDETMALFTTDVIGTTAFGLEPETLKNPNSKFREMGKRFFAPTFRNTFLFFLRFAFPHFVISMKLRTTEKPISDYFLSLSKDVIKYRMKNSVTRKDFIQLAIQLKEKGFIENDSLEADDELQVSYKENNLENFVEITDELLAAQSFVFYVAGYETTSKTFYYLTYLLSLHKDVQDKAREEVRKTKMKHKDFTYESLKDLKYLENCISETLRLFPPLPFLNRVCTKECSLPDGTKIEKGKSIAIPTFSVQRDPKYFPEPEAFKPERFEQQPIQGTYFPFGDGPRICIGKRFALIELKMTMAKLLDRYSFERSDLTKTPVQFDTFVTLTPANPLWVKMVKC